VSEQACIEISIESFSAHFSPVFSLSHAIFSPFLGFSLQNPRSLKIQASNLKSDFGNVILATKSMFSPLDLRGKFEISSFSSVNLESLSLIFQLSLSFVHLGAFQMISKFQVEFWWI